MNRLRRVPSVQVGVLAVAGLLAASLPAIAAAAPLDPVTSTAQQRGAAGSPHELLFERGTAAPDAGATAAATPTLKASVVETGLDIPWDVAVLPSGAWLITERDRERISLRTAPGQRRVLADTPPGFWHAGETGMMSIVADPRVAKNDRFYTCNGFYAGDNPEVRVVAWRLNEARTGVRRIGPLLTGIDITTEGGHGGCRLRFDPNGTMYVGTGDATISTHPQDLKSLNGKVLRLNRFSGKPSPTNPWPNAANRQKRYIYTYGHRNVQGLAWRPGDRMWSVEHGTERDDEVNRLFPGANYGWDPGPGYDESVPMTDFSLPGKQHGARWKSGYPTIATSGATWVRGAEWGSYRGTLAVCALKASKLVFMRFDGGRFVDARVPAVTNGTYGRLRSVVQTKSGALLVTTANGYGEDKIIKVTPR